MVQVYSVNNTNYKRNGDAVLLATVCELEATINGSWELTLEHPIDNEGRWRFLAEGAVLKAPSFNGLQLFRVAGYELSDDGVRCTAYPIFFDSATSDLVPEIKGKKNPSQILAAATAGTPYTYESNVTGAKAVDYQLRSILDILNGDSSDSITKLWDGELLFNNYKVEYKDTIGRDNGVRILYGKNILGIRETVNFSGITTKIYPVSYGGTPYKVNGQVAGIESPLINDYPTTHAKKMVFDNIKLTSEANTEEPEPWDVVCQTLPELYAALEARARREFEKGIDKPAVEIEIEMALLQNTQEYKQYKRLETVSLGDTVHAQHSKLGIETTTRVFAIKYDCIKDEVAAVTLTSVQPTYYDQTGGAIRTAQKLKAAVTDNGKLVAAQVEGLLDGAKTQLRIQQNAAIRQDAVAILFEDLDPTSETYGALAIGTNGLQISKTRSGNEWIWTTAATSEGIIANAVITGLLTDKLGRNYWNLDTGELSISGYTTDEEAQGYADTALASAKTYADSAATSAVNAQTQLQIFNKLTNNGQAQGIYLKDGKVYINGSYIAAGTIAGVNINGGTVTEYTNGNKSVELKGDSLIVYDSREANREIGRLTRSLDSSGHDFLTMRAVAGNTLELATAVRNDATNASGLRIRTGTYNTPSGDTAAMVSSWRAYCGHCLTKEGKQILPNPVLSFAAEHPWPVVIGTGNYGRVLTANHEASGPDIERRGNVSLWVPREATIENEAVSKYNDTLVFNANESNESALHGIHIYAPFQEGNMEAFVWDAVNTRVRICAPGPTPHSCDKSAPIVFSAQNSETAHSRRTDIAVPWGGSGASKVGLTITANDSGTKVTAAGDNLRAKTYEVVTSSGLKTGASGTFTAGSTTITVTNGIITSIA